MRFDARCPKDGSALRPWRSGVARSGDSLGECPLCHIIWTLPYKTDEELAPLYADRESKDFVPGDLAPISVVKDAIARWQLRAMARRLGSAPDSMLDLGTGNGRYAIAARDLGWPAVTAADMHESPPAALQHAAQGQAPVRFVRQRELDRYAGAFDFVLYRHVLEHTADPYRALGEIRRLLRPGGACYVEVPNIESWSARTLGYSAQPLYLPWHRVHFRAPVLDATLRAAGLEPFAAGGKTMPKIADQLQFFASGVPRPVAQVIGAAMQPVQLLFEGMLGRENLWVMARRGE